MTTNATAVAFTKLYIGPTGSIPSSPDLFTEIKEIFNVGDLGIMFNMIQTNSLGDGYDRELKGTVKVTQFPLVLNRSINDPGQILLKAAAAVTTQALYPFKMTFNDAVSTPTTIYFQGKVTGFVTKGGEANTVRRVDSGISVEMDTITETLAA